MIRLLFFFLFTTFCLAANGQSSSTSSPGKPSPDDYVLIVNTRTGKTDTMWKKAANKPATQPEENRPAAKDRTTKAPATTQNTGTPKGKAELTAAKKHATGNGNTTTPPAKKETPGDNNADASELATTLTNTKNIQDMVIMVSDRMGMDNRIPGDARPVLIDKSLLEVKRPEHPKDTIDIIRPAASSKSFKAPVIVYIFESKTKVDNARDYYMGRHPIRSSKMIADAAIQEIGSSAAVKKVSENNNTTTATKNAAMNSKMALAKHEPKKTQPPKIEYPIIIDVPNGAPSTINSGDFPRQYTTADRTKKPPVLFVAPSDKFDESDYEIPVANARLKIEIKLDNAEIRNIKDLKLYVTITNPSAFPQTFLFDRPIQPGFAMWNAGCKIVGRAHPDVLESYGKPEFNVKKMASKKYNKYITTIQGHEWFIRKFAVANLVVVNPQVVKNGRLPADTYTLQLFVQGNPSNIVSFTVR